MTSKLRFFCPLRREEEIRGQICNFKEKTLYFITGMNSQVKKVLCRGIIHVILITDGTVLDEEKRVKTLKRRISRVINFE